MRSNNQSRRDWERRINNRKRAKWSNSRPVNVVSAKPSRKSRFHTIGLYAGFCTVHIRAVENGAGGETIGVARRKCPAVVGESGRLDVARVFVISRTWPAMLPSAALVTSQRTLKPASTTKDPVLKIPKVSPKQTVCSAGEPSPASLLHSATGQLNGYSPVAVQLVGAPMTETLYVTDTVCDSATVLGVADKLSKPAQSALATGTALQSSAGAKKSTLNLGSG